MLYNYIKMHGTKKNGKKIFGWYLNIREKWNWIYLSYVLLRVNQAFFTASASLERLWAADDLASLLIVSRALFFSDGMNK